MKFMDATKMNIGIDASIITSKKSGIGWYIVNLIENLSVIDKDNNYFIYLNKPLKEKPIVGSNFIYIEDNWDKRILWQIFKLPKLLRKADIDVFHSPDSDAPLFYKKNIVSTVHDLMVKKYNKDLSLKAKLYYNFFINLVVRKAKNIISDSESTKKDIINIYKKKNITVIPLAGDPYYKKIEISEEIENISKTKFKVNERFCLFVGADNRKNLLNSLRALSLLKNEKIQVVICGVNKSFIKEIESYTKKLNLSSDKLLILGYVSKTDLRILYNLAEFLLYPSFYEGFGMPILEAMACGCPVITSNTSSMPEVAGKAALLVDPNNIIAIKNSIENILKNINTREDMVRKGYLQVSNFSWRKVAIETLSVYTDAVREDSSKL